MDKIKTKKPLARLVVNDAEYAGNLVILAKWLRNLANEFIKNARKQNKDKEPRYSKRFIARHF